MPNLLKTKRLFLSFANINVQINLHQPEFNDSKSWGGIIYRAHHNFLLERRPDRIDFTLDFLEGDPRFYNIHGNELVSLIAKTKTRNSMEIYYSARLTHLQWILKHILEKQPRKILMLHGSGAALGQKTILFLGKSGSGKSTVIRLLRKNCKIVSDDSVLVANEKEPTVYQTPFIEKEKWLEKDREVFGLGKIFFLRKAKRFRMRKITSQEEVYRLLTSATILPKLDKHGLKRTLDFVIRFDGFYYLYFAKNSQLSRYVPALFG